MTQAAVTDYESPRPTPPPRLLAGVVICLVQWMIIKVPSWVAPLTMVHLLGNWAGPAVGLVGILIWWFGFTRLSSKTRWTGFGVFVAAGVITWALAHHTMPMALFTLALPVAVSVWGIWPWLGLSLGLGEQRMRVVLVAMLLVIWGFFTTLRMDGLQGNVKPDYSWRWSMTAEERYLASRTNRAVPAMVDATPLTLSPAEWPGFRGPKRDGVLHGTSIRTDWAARTPKLVWKHLIGPGWSSMCIVGDRLFTQEQRGPTEVVVCYKASTGEELWSHEDPDRFEEAMAGPGPRATPTFDHGRLYAYGAKGRLNCLDPITGKVLWMRDVAKESGAALPIWGFASSPLIANGLVTVITGAPGKSVMAYNADTGAPAWQAGSGYSYCSPQISRVDGVDQLLFATAAGITALDPADGHILWDHSFNIGQMNRVVQPLMVNDTDVLLGAGLGIGTRRLHVTHTGGTWKVESGWTSRSLKPYYNDMVLHKGNVYGFDDSTFCCINPETGKANWRAPGAYGNGQVLLLADQDLLLILSDTGEVALVDAKPDAHHEVARFPAIEGKTWNHPVIVNGKLFVRNGQEMACYDLK